jgi:hypothetical protein
MDFAHGTMILVRSTATTTDDYGDETTATTETPWGPCAIAPRASTERVDPNAPAVIVGLSIAGPPIRLDSDDLLVIPEGHYYAGAWQVEGIPADYHHPMTGWHPGIEVAVKRASSV